MKRPLMFSRKVVRIGGSVTIALPREVRVALAIHPGNYVRMALHEDALMLVKEKGISDASIDIEHKAT